MAEPAHIRVYEKKANQYASQEDFHRVFSEDADGLYRLSLLLTRDPVKAERCFVGGLEDCVAGNSVFREWAHSWARRAIIQNAIRELKPRRIHSNSRSSETIFPDIDQLSSSRDGHFAMDAVLGLEDFERFVFILSVLEHYSEHDCVLLLRCSVKDIREGRTRAFRELMDSNHRDPSQSQAFAQETK